MERDFKGIWIPKEIWLNPDLSALEKVVFAEIDSLDGEQGCYASNEYLATFCNCSVSKIVKAIKKLKDLGLIYIKSFDGRTRFIGSYLSKLTEQTGKKYHAELQKVPPINIDNNIDNTLSKDRVEAHSKVERFQKPTLEEINDYIKANNLKVDGERFFNYYEGNGWHVGRVKMSSWKATLKNWNKSEKKRVKYDVKDMEADESVDLVKLSKELFGDD